MKPGPKICPERVKGRRRYLCGCCISVLAVQGVLAAFASDTIARMLAKAAKAVGSFRRPGVRCFHPNDALGLETIDVNLFRANSEHLWRPVAARGVFGGQIIGQVRNSSATPRRRALKSLRTGNGSGTSNHGII